MTYPLKELKRRARISLTGKYFLSNVMIILVFLGTMLLSSLLDLFAFNPIISVLAYLIVYLLQKLFSIGLRKFYYSLAKEETFHLKDLFYGFFVQSDTFLLVIIFISLVSGIWFVPALLFSFLAPIELPLMTYCLICFGLLAFGAIPGIFFSLRYSLAFYLILEDSNISARDALRGGRQLVCGHMKQYFLLNLSFLPWILLVIGSFGLGYFYFFAYIQTTETHFYLGLTESPVVEPSVEL